MGGGMDRQGNVKRDRSGLVIGSRAGSALRNTLLTCQGDVVRGHEFHYSCLNAPVARKNAAYTFTARGQTEGCAPGNLLASYWHLFFSGVPLAAPRFVALCRRCRRTPVCKVA